MALGELGNFTSLVLSVAITIVLASIKAESITLLQIRIRSCFGGSATWYYCSNSELLHCPTYAARTLP